MSCNHPALNGKVASARYCNCSAAPQMREMGLRAIASLCKQAYGKADAALLNSYDER